MLNQRNFISEAKEIPSGQRAVRPCEASALAFRASLVPMALKNQCHRDSVLARPSSVSSQNLFGFAFQIDIA